MGKKRLNILVTNDDGVEAPGIACLAEIAKQFGDVTVAAPASQCSAMSQRITIFEPVNVERCDFPVEGVDAWSIGGTPADCVKIAFEHVLEKKPDIVFSGINNGYNAGYDICYSGTVGAAMEGVMHGAAAVAFSTAARADLSACRKYLPELITQIIGLEVPDGVVWNINVPGCPAEEVKGILWARKPAPLQLYKDDYIVDDNGDGTMTVHAHGTPVGPDDAPEGTDIHAALNGYVSVGCIHCMASE